MKKILLPLLLGSNLFVESQNNIINLDFNNAVQSYKGYYILSKPEKISIEKDTFSILLILKSQLLLSRFLDKKLSTTNCLKKFLY
jgi:hypothetical protein